MLGIADFIIILKYVKQKKKSHWRLFYIYISIDRKTRRPDMSYKIIDGLFIQQTSNNN